MVNGHQCHLLVGEGGTYFSCNKNVGMFVHKVIIGVYGLWYKRYT